MRLKVLGCSGGVAEGRRTSTFLLDDDILVDAGSGVGDLSLEAMAKIEHVFLTHSHLDHTAFLPLLADAALEERPGPLIVHALPETLAALQNCVFNWSLWPDYTVLPSPENPYVRFEPLGVGQEILLGERSIAALPVKHSIPALAYRLDSGSASLVYSGDTTYCPAFWDALNVVPSLEYLLIEVSYLNGGEEKAQRSGHHTPRLLLQGMERLVKKPRLYITHLEPAIEEETMAQVGEMLKAYAPSKLVIGHEFLF
ncbi:MAG: 3',5'-cyclic-nucleotide phosphodiesterase [Burkholderiales bacterium]